MNGLKKISVNSIKLNIPKNDLVSIQKNFNHVFILEKTEPFKDREIDNLIEIEIAVRKCRRVGVFN